MTKIVITVEDFMSAEPLKVNTEVDLEEYAHKATVVLNIITKLSAILAVSLDSIEAGVTDPEGIRKELRKIYDID